MAESITWCFRTVLETKDATIDIFTDAITIKHDKTGVVIEIGGDAFQFLKDQMNNHG